MPVASNKLENHITRGTMWGWTCCWFGNEQCASLCSGLADKRVMLHPAPFSRAMHITVAPLTHFAVNLLLGLAKIGVPHGQEVSTWAAMLVQAPSTEADQQVKAAIARADARVQQAYQSSINARAATPMPSAE